MVAPTRMRMSRTALLPVVLLLLCVLPAASVAPWALVLLLVPLAAAAWVLRVGLDISDDGLTVRSLAGHRRVSWAEVAGIRVGERGELWLVTTRGTEVALPVLRARDLPRLAAVSGGRFPVSEPPSRG